MHVDKEGRGDDVSLNTSPSLFLSLSLTDPLATIVMNQVALIWDSPLAGRSLKYTYRQLRDEVAKFAACLDDQGVKMGDRVMIYMPMIPEAVIAMLASARIGAVHSVVFGGKWSSWLILRPGCVIMMDASCFFRLCSQGGGDPCERFASQGPGDC